MYYFYLKCIDNLHKMCYYYVSRSNTKRVAWMEVIELEKVFRNIRAECARNAMSIEDLSKALDIERKTFYNWEAKQDFPASYLVKMAKVFRVSVDTLLGLDKVS